MSEEDGNRNKETAKLRPKSKWKRKIKSNSSGCLCVRMFYFEKISLFVIAIIKWYNESNSDGWPMANRSGHGAKKNQQQRATVGWNGTAQCERKKKKMEIKMNKKVIINIRTCLVVGRWPSWPNNLSLLVALLALPNPEIHFIRFDIISLNVRNKRRKTNKHPYIHALCTTFLTGHGNR